jgi:hypothetical protein
VLVKHALVKYNVVHQDYSFSTYNSKNNKFLSLETKNVNVLIPEDEYSILKLFFNFQILILVLRPAQPLPLKYGQKLYFKNLLTIPLIQS